MPIRMIWKKSFSFLLFFANIFCILFLYLSYLASNFRAIVVMSAMYYVWGFALILLASEGSQKMGNYSITKLDFVIIVVLN